MTRLALLPLILVLPACLEPEDDIVDFMEDFEACGTCNWETSGEVSVVTTNHPGEHAVRLGAGARLQHPLAIERFDEDENAYQGNFTDGNWIEYSTDCAGPPRLAIESPFGGVELFVRVRLEGPADEDGGFVRRKLMFPPLPIYDEYERVVFSQLFIETGAPCRLDNVRLLVSGGTLGY